MAEGLARHIAGKDARFSGFVFKSAGTYAFEGGPASEEAVIVLEEIGADISGHMSQHFSSSLAEWADIILAMEQGHLHEMALAAPAHKNKMHTLLAFAQGTSGDISDPYGGSLVMYRKTRDQIAAAVEKALAKMLGK